MVFFLALYLFNKNKKTIQKIKNKDIGHKLITFFPNLIILNVLFLNIFGINHLFIFNYFVYIPSVRHVSGNID